MNASPSHPNPLLRAWNLRGHVDRPEPFYRLARCMLQMALCSAWRLRVFDRHHEPAEGGTVYICNHQSFMDPPLMGIALKRPVSFMARDSLFHHPVFGYIIESVNAFPVRRGQADLTALKEAMRRLKAGGQVAVFAEGTRTQDGHIARFLPGVAILAQRAAEWTVPVLIEGAYEAWPRRQGLPSLGGRIVVQYAPAIPRAEAKKHTPADFVRSVRQTLIEMQHDVRKTLGKPALEYE